MADAQASGACGSNIVWVQVPSPALKKDSSRWMNPFCLSIVFKPSYDYEWSVTVACHTEGYSCHRNLIIILEMGLQREEIESILY